ncbi:hypothetical protein [Alloactinosynnema sp. L-07]|uniref:Ig-like domain-containing protein n=1 Tax=Alloactinosynnema sp. L-07 TaxID=1653480 RepID=UPI00065F073D|nr:Ig-like domain-containing protein [Alloactinosynnema sp. L-07]CRK62099.1 hypothetical protein [Alloactinosynnema sp. L-07]
MARRAVGFAVAFAAAAAATIGAAGIAAAAPAVKIGNLTASKASGSDIEAPGYTTSGGCPTDSDGYEVRIYGPGAFTPGLVATTVTDVNFSTTSAFSVVQTLSFKDVAVDNSTTIVPGLYTVAVNCLDQLAAAEKGSFTVDLNFTTATAWTVVANKVNTTTALSAAPAAPVTAGSAVTLTATVSPSTTGQVQFRDGANALGAPVAVNNGVATLTTSALAVGARSLTAEFLGSATHNGSTSAALAYQVNPAPAGDTTTALAVTPSGTAAQYSTVTLAATVAPATAAGTVQFFDGANALGNPVTVANGSASVNNANFAVGAHSFTVRFIPANPALFNPSVSAAVALEITAFAGVTTYEDITTTVLAGELTISVANQNVVLPSPVMAADGSLLTTAGSLNPIKVTDTRAGNPGWNVSGQVTDFINGANSINGANLGWTPKIVDKSPVQVITAGALVDPANAIVPGATAPNGLGLATARVLASAAALGGNGTANLTADLALKVPTSTVAGTYTARLTLTAI